MMINQFALFDKDAFMTRGMLLYLGEGAAAFVDGRAWLVMSGLVAALTLVYLWMSSRSNQMYLIGTLAVINVWILFSAYMDRNNNNNFIYEYDTSSAGVENGKKFINIYLSNAAPYGYLNEMKDANAKDNSKLENLQKSCLASTTATISTFIPTLMSNTKTRRKTRLKFSILWSAETKTSPRLLRINAATGSSVP